MVMNFIGVCTGSYTGNNGKLLYLFKVGGILETVRVSQDYAPACEKGKKYMLRCVPRRFEEKAFFAFVVVCEV